jgi:O-methyltransferase
MLTLKARENPPHKVSTGRAGCRSLNRGRSIDRSIASEVLPLAINELRYRRIHRKYGHYTMIPCLKYCGNLHLAKTVASVAGTIVECGTWRGGMIAGIADVLGCRRSYYLCDSFQGLPPAKEIDGDAARAWQANNSGSQYYDNCTASEEEARSAMAMSPARDYRILKGWFEQTLPKFPPEPIALLRMDADWYDSTKCILENLADLVVPGGLILVDDYYSWEGCTVAVNEFAARNKWRIRQSHHGICHVVV